MGGTAKDSTIKQPSKKKNARKARNRTNQEATLARTIQIKYRQNQEYKMSANKNQISVRKRSRHTEANDATGI